MAVSGVPCDEKLVPLPCQPSGTPLSVGRLKRREAPGGTADSVKLPTRTPLGSWSSRVRFVWSGPTFWTWTPVLQPSAVRARFGAQIIEDPKVAVVYAVATAREGWTPLTRPTS